MRGPRPIEAVIIGGGHAGLAASQALQDAGIPHLLMERGRIAESWRTQRWDSFTLNTPGSLSLLPGDASGPGPLESFWHRDAFVQYLEGGASRLHAEIRTGVTVVGVEDQSGRRGFLVHTNGSEAIRTRAVVVAAGTQRRPRIPAFASDLPPAVLQLHALDYRNPDALPAGAVLVVGSAQSGIQIAEDLLDAGKTVHLSTGRVGRVRRRYRGVDSFVRLFPSPWFDQTPAQLPDPAAVTWAQPQISGVGPLGHSVSLQWLEARGVRLLGRSDGVRDHRLALRDDLGANIAWGDRFSASVTQMMEAAIVAAGADADPIEDDPGDWMHPDPASVHAATELDLVDAGISTVIWTTGVAGDVSFLPTAAVAADGALIHREGVSPIPGLYYLAIPWMRSRGSAVIAGAGRDARFIAGRIQEHLAAS